jgi:uncharacterized protein (DUF2164 family)
VSGVKKAQFQIPKEIKQHLIASVKAYFAEERDEDLGDLSAELILDFFIQNAGPAIYNQAIADAKKFMGEKVEVLYALEKVVP